MASAELQRLWKLSQIDSGLVEVRMKAATLDVGKKIAAEIVALQKKDEEVSGRAKQLQAQLTDLEIAQKGIEEKLKRIDKQIYGGSGVSPREVENLEKEIASLKKQRDLNDTKLLELWEIVPPAKEAAEKMAQLIAAKQKQLTDRKKAAIAERAALEAEFSRLNKLRPDALKGIPPGLMAKYDGIRGRTDGVGMAEVVRKSSCAACGTLIPERALEGLKEDKVVTCESCHRILYYTEGVV